jgi:hypothetical protein
LFLFLFLVRVGVLLVCGCERERAGDGAVDEVLDSRVCLFALAAATAVSRRRHGSAAELDCVRVGRIARLQFTTERSID